LRDSLAPASALAILSAFFGRPQTHAPDPSL
jgi:hypothetical protein